MRGWYKPNKICLWLSKKSMFFPGDAEHKSSQTQNEGLLKLDVLLWFGLSSSYSQTPKSRSFKAQQRHFLQTCWHSRASAKDHLMGGCYQHVTLGFRSALAAFLHCKSTRREVTPPGFFHFTGAAGAACSYQPLKSQESKILIHFH